MKNLVAFLGCGVLALAIGCGDGGSAPVAPTAPAMSPDMVKSMQNPTQPTAAEGEKPADGGEKKEGDAPAEKKEGDAPAEKKEGDAPAEKKEGDAPAEKKE